jgi:hypothetical protein
MTTACSDRPGTLPSASSAQTPQLRLAQASVDLEEPATAFSSNAYRSCGAPAPGHVACFAIVRTDAGGGAPDGYHGQFRATDARSLASPDAAPQGYGPRDLVSAYRLPSDRGAGQTIAVIDAFDDPNAESDLGVYRAQYRLPACTTANGCFTKVAADGTTDYPKKNAGWDQEISVDLDAASATCPKCKLLLVEAAGTSDAQIDTAVNEAAKLGPNVISNSYGGDESNASDPAYDHPGIILTASAGDGGYGPQQPASYASVVAVGGTSLQRTGGSGRGWSETVWSDTGSGCSAFVAKPKWQNGTGCSLRAEVDVAADADPNTGIAVYDTVPYQGSSGWLVFGGTSVSSPVVAGVYALAGNAAEFTAAKHLWSTAGAHLFDVTSGRNADECSPASLCAAGTGYDGPTGWGTPDGVSAF